MKNTKMLALVLLLVAAVFAVFRFWNTVMMIFTAAIVAYLLGPLARWLTQKTKLPHGVSVAIILVFVLILVLMLLFSSVPYIINQITGLVQDLSATGTLDDLLNRFYEYMNNLGLPQSILNGIVGFTANIDDYLMSLLTTILQGLINLSLGLLDLVILVILVIYFMLDGVKITASMVAQLPLRMRPSVERITKASREMTRKYIKTRVLISTGMAIVIYIGFQIMGIRYALLFAVISFVFDFIPYFGSIAAGVIETLYVLIARGPGMALTALIFVLIVQQLEGNVIAPKVEGDAIGLHPIVIIAALLVCNQLFGPAGMLISTPLAAVGKTVLKEVYRYIVTPEDDDPRQLTIEKESN